jgi:hypothetical protein
MTSKLKIIFAVTSIFFLLSISTYACTCVREKIKVKGFSGQVFAVHESRPDDKQPLPRAVIKLLKRTDDGDKLIAEVVANEKGWFSLTNIQAGKYILEAAAPNFDKVVTEIKIFNSPSRKTDKLEIGLEPGITCCGGYAKAQKATTS